jgi:hypothetical protein
MKTQTNENGKGKLFVYTIVNVAMFNALGKEIE